MDFTITAADLVAAIQQKDPDIVEWAVLSLQNQQLQARVAEYEATEGDKVEG